MTGGHGEWFVQNFAADGSAQDEVRSLSPEAAREACRHRWIAGSKSGELAALRGNGAEAVDLLPDARHVALLAPELLTDDLSPIYGRPPDAKLPGARR